MCKCSWGGGGGGGGGGQGKQMYPHHEGVVKQGEGVYKRIQNMFGKVVKRERPEKNPKNSMIVNVKVRLNATSNLEREGGREEEEGRGDQ